MLTRGRSSIRRRAGPGRRLVKDKRIKALGLALFNHAYVQVYDSVTGQLVLCVVVGLYAAGIVWMRALARFPVPERLLAGPGSMVTPELH